ncbi:MAG TPA: decarboxylating 6-phosphogluconate dehydrogenase [Ignavibacteria bacterium]|jgi:6-phosphogluconate dehydrogenase
MKKEGEINMQVGFIGLGKMGGYMIERLLKGEHQVVVYDINADAVKNAEKIGASGSKTIAELVSKLAKPRIVWIMVPSGKPVQDTIERLTNLLDKGDIIIDGGNSYYKDSKNRAEYLTKYNLHLIDAGTSGGVWGLKEGYCIMVGGEKGVFDYTEPIFKTLAPPGGYKYIGSNGAGHYVKMVHNGIEYGLMEAYAEGFEIMHASEYNVDLAEVAELWGKGSVVRSWLLELLTNALKDDNELSSIRGYIEDSGEGRWTIAEAIEKNIPAPVITESLLVRLRSRQEESYGAKIIAALRNQFGGHATRKK